MVKSVMTELGVTKEASRASGGLMQRAAFFAAGALDAAKVLAARQGKPGRL